MRKYFLWLCLLALSLCQAEDKTGSRIVFIDGVQLTAGNYTIVLPEKPTLQEKRSAEELQKYLLKMTGEKISVISGSLPESGRKGLFIGRFEVPGQKPVAALGAIVKWAFDITPSLKLCGVCTVYALSRST